MPIVAPRSPGDCFDAAIEAARIALTYRTPVFLLSDGYLANGSEPWAVPSVDELPDLHVEFATEPNGDGPEASGEFLPYLRDPRDPRAAVGGAGHGRARAPHRRASRRPTAPATSATTRTTTTSWSVPARRRSTASPRPDPADGDRGPGSISGDARVLVLGWGSTYGPIGAACRQVRATGASIAQAHLRHLQPVPVDDLGDVLRSLRPVVIPEMNLGQLATADPGEVPDRRHQRITQVRGLPFKADELAEMLLAIGVSHQWLTEGDSASRPRTSRPTRRCAGARAAGTTRSWPPSRASCPSSAWPARTSCSSPASVARRGSRTT